MSGGGLDIAFGGAAPDGDEARGPGTSLESAHVGADLLGQVHLVLALLDVGPVDHLDVVVIEDGFLRLDGLEQRLYLVEQVALEHPGFAGGGVHVVFENVPASEYQVIEPGERD